MRPATFRPAPICMILTCAVVTSAGLAQGSADLRFAPQQGAEFYVQKIVSTTLNEHDQPGASGTVTKNETHFMSFRCEVTEVIEESGEVTQVEEIRHLRIEVERPGWDAETYDSNIAKRAAPAPLRKLDAFISRQSQLSVIANASGNVLQIVHVPVFKETIDRYFELFDSPVGPMETLRTGIVTHNFDHSFGAGLGLLPGAEQQAGDTWTRSSRIIVPYIGECAIVWSCTLEEIDGELAVITATPSISVTRAYEPIPAASFVMGDAVGRALLRYDTDANRPVFFESSIDVPLDVSLLNPLGERDEFKANLIMSVELEEIGQLDIPPRGQPGGRAWLDGER